MHTCIHKQHNTHQNSDIVLAAAPQRLLHEVLADPLGRPPLRQARPDEVDCLVVRHHVPQSVASDEEETGPCIVPAPGLYVGGGGGRVIFIRHLANMWSKIKNNNLTRSQLCPPSGRISKTIHLLRCRRCSEEILDLPGDQVTDSSRKRGPSPVRRG